MHQHGMPSQRLRRRTLAPLLALSCALLAPSATPTDEGPPSPGGAAPPASTQADNPSETRRYPTALGLLVSPSDPLAASRVAGARLALLSLTARGGPTLSLRVAATRDRWTGVADAARELVCEAGCAGLITPPDGDAAHLVEQIAARTQVPVVVLGGQGSLTRVTLPLVVRAGPADRDQLRTLLGELAGETALTIPALLPAGRDGRHARADIEAVALALDVPIALLPVAPGDDVLQLLRREGARVSSPVIIWLGEVQTRAAVTALEGGGWSGPVLLSQHGIAGLWTDDHGLGGLELRAVRLLSRAPGRQARAFASAFRLAYGYAPDEAAAFAFDAALALARAVCTPSPRAAPWSPDSPPPGLEGVTGPLTFDDTGERTSRFEPWRSASRPRPSGNKPSPSHHES